MLSIRPLQACNGVHGGGIEPMARRVLCMLHAYHGQVALWQAQASAGLPVGVLNALLGPVNYHARFFLLPSAGLLDARTDLERYVQCSTPGLLGLRPQQAWWHAAGASTRAIIANTFTCIETARVTSLSLVVEPGPPPKLLLGWL